METAGRHKGLRPKRPQQFQGLDELFAENYLLAGDFDLQGQSAITRLITPSGSAEYTELKSQISGTYPIENLIGKGATSEVYRVPGIDYVARMSRFLVSPETVKELIKLLPEDRIAISHNGDIFFNFEGSTTQEVVYFDEALHKVIPDPVDPLDLEDYQRQYIQQSPLINIRSALMIHALADKGVVDDHLNPPIEVALMNKQGRYAAYSIEKLLRGVAWGNVSSEFRAWDLLGNQSTNIQRAAYAYQRWYSETGFLHGDLKREHMHVDGVLKMLDFNNALIPGIQPPPFPVCTLTVTAPEMLVMGKRPTLASEVCAFVSTSIEGLTGHNPRMMDKEGSVEQVLENRLPLLEGGGRNLNQGLVKIGIDLGYESLQELGQFMRLAVGSNPVFRPSSMTLAAWLLTESMAATFEEDGNYRQLRQEIHLNLIKYFNSMRTGGAHSSRDSVIKFLEDFPDQEYILGLERYLAADWGPVPRSLADVYDNILARLEAFPDF